MARVEINNGGHQVVVDDPSGQRAEVAREARRLWEKTKLSPTVVGFGRPVTSTTPPVSDVRGSPTAKIAPKPQAMSCHHRTPSQRQDIHDPHRPLWAVGVRAQLGRPARRRG